MDMDLSDITMENIHLLNKSHVETILRAIFTPSVWLTMSEVSKVQSKYLLLRYLASSDRERFSVSQYIRAELQMLNEFEEDRQLLMAQINSFNDLRLPRHQQRPPSTADDRSVTSSEPYYEFLLDDPSAGVSWYAEDTDSLETDSTPSTSDLAGQPMETDRRGRRRNFTNGSDSDSDSDED